MYVLPMCFFFQAEDGIRDYKVTGVQTCALPIFAHSLTFHYQVANAGVVTGPGVGTWTAFSTLDFTGPVATATAGEIGRASCRERERGSVAAAVADETEAEQGVAAGGAGA